MRKPTSVNKGHAYRTPTRFYGRPGSVSVSKIKIPARLERALGKVSNLPTLPTVVANMMSLVDNPRTSARDLERQISNDPALTAKILRLVNSAYYGFPNRIGTVSLAVVILGFDTVKAMALTVSVFNMFDNGEGKNGFDAEAFWEHSFGSALAAEILSRTVRYRAKGEAFTAGVLHDVGKIALDYFVKDKFQKVISVAVRDSMHILDAEQEVLGTTHAEIGGWLAQLWNLPHHLGEAISLHHDPSKAKLDPVLASIVHLADILCRRRQIGSGGDETIPEIAPCTWPTLRLRSFGFEDGDMEALLSQLDNEMDRMEAFSSIIRGTGDEPPK